MADDRSDTQLLQAWEKGDLLAFEALYRRHRGTVYTLLWNTFGRFADADKVYRRAWLAAFTTRRPTGTADFPRWFLPGACVAILTRLARRHPFPSHRYPPRPNEAPAPTGVFASRRALQLAIERLPDAQRVALLLQLEFGLDAAAIAIATRVPADTVSRRLASALAKVGDALHAPGEGPPSGADEPPGKRIGSLYRSLPRYDPASRLDRYVLAAAARVRDIQPSRRRYVQVTAWAVIALATAALLAWAFHGWIST
ncbi:MAG: sigma factor-like helix-turn-helix DNA-binding protein [Lysobacterales bacterium]